MAGTAPVRRKKRHFRNQAKGAPYQVELEKFEDGTDIPAPGDDGDPHESERWMSLRNMNELEGHTGFQLVRISQTDPEAALRILVGEDNWPRFWAEYRTEEFGSLTQLMNEVIEHSTSASAGNS